MALQLRESDQDAPRALARSAYSIWWFAGLFVVLATAAVLAVMFVPPRDSETVRLPSRAPGGVAAGGTTGAAGGTTIGSSGASGGSPSGAASGSSSASGVGAAAGTGSTAPVTVPGGAAAPAGVTKVLATEGSTSYSFAVPAAVNEQRVRAAVPPATAVASPDGTQLLVTVSCGLLRNEVLAQVSVSEGDSTVTVLPVVLVPDKGDPCPAGTEVGRVTLPLATPLGTRQVFVAPVGTQVPTPN